jgi:hypothetical protein
MTMIRITSIDQALALRGTIPELAIIRSIQFMGDGYSPEEHGHIIVMQEGDDIIKEIGGIFDDDNLPAFEIIESFVDGESVVFEILFALDSDRTIALITEQSCLDDDLRDALLEYSPPPQPMPTLDRRAL